jgi:hypothetical protein
MSAVKLPISCSSHSNSWKYRRISHSSQLGTHASLRPRSLVWALSLSLHLRRISMFEVQSTVRASVVRGAVPSVAPTAPRTYCRVANHAKHKRSCATLRYAVLSIVPAADPGFQCALIADRRVRQSSLTNVLESDSILRARERSGVLEDMQARRAIYCHQ